ncbi:MAG: hypothetical protein AAGG55_10710 [Pseudomonadota bacterium]
MAMDSFTPKARALVIVTALLLALPTLLIPWVDDAERARWEKRDLAEFPDAKRLIDGDYFGEIEGFLDDHLYGAFELNKLYRRIQLQIFGDSPLPNVAIGDDGFVFLTSHDAEHPKLAVRRLCLPQREQIERLHRGLEDLAGRLRSDNIRLIVTVMPSKMALYPDKLPDQIGGKFLNLCRETAIQNDWAPAQLAELADGYEVFYPLSQLGALRDTPHFYPPANFHANSRANHEFAKEYFRAVGIAETVGDVKVRISTINADLKMLGITRKTEVWQYEYVQGIRRFRRVPAWVRESYPSVRGFSRFETSQPLREGRALILSNSFGAYLAPHLAPGYRELAQTDFKNLFGDQRDVFLQRAIKEARPDDLLLVVHDAGLLNAPLARFLGFQH